MTNNLYNKTKKYASSNSETPRKSQLVYITTEVFPMIFNNIATPREGPFAENISIKGIFGKQKVSINKKEKTISYYNNFYKKKANKLLQRYNEITPEKDWKLLHPKSKTMKKILEAQ